MVSSSHGGRGTVNIPTKEGDIEIPLDWITIWNQVYYDVPRTLEDIRIWCYDNPQKRKTKRGLRAFLGRWIRKSCTKRPAIASVSSHGESRENVVGLRAGPEVARSYLSQLKAMVSK